MNDMGSKKFDVVSSLHAQIPHFSCLNHFLDNKSQDDINRYIFMSNYNTPAYPGSYGELPKKWIKKVEVISYHIEKRNQKMQSKMQNKMRNNPNGS
tara:strand:- start:395 stop:682 length:288 start_codon:yes stop_codon:yes gene_type:complete